MPSIPSTAPTITPQANPALNAQPGESIQDYEARLGKMSAGTGTGFGTPAPISLPSGIPNVTDTKVTGTQSAEDKVAQQLGYKNYQDALANLTAPADDTTSFYNDAYKNAGLDQLHAKITQRQADLNKALGNINDNPWLDEATRVGRSKTLQDLANADIKNWQDAYDTGLKQVNTLVSQHQKELQGEATANKAKLTALENQAKALASEAATNAKGTAAPKTIKAPDGTVYQWNSSSGKFEPLFSGTSSPSKPTTSDAISSMTSEIQGLLGSTKQDGTPYSTDGYISPQDWDTALKAWNAKGLSTSSFISNFKRYANPNDTYTGITKKSSTNSTPTSIPGISLDESSTTPFA